MRKAWLSPASLGRHRLPAEVRAGFVIMQIGNDELDALYREVIAPAMTAERVAPLRVDKHNEGRLLNSEIAAFIRDADIIVADLTNERPNCYLEVGYAMGLNKFSNLILCARMDHKPDRPDRRVGEPRVHFDLGGYDFLYWDPSDLAGYRAELQRRIAQRVRHLPALAPALGRWSDESLATHRQTVAQGAARQDVGYMEVLFSTRRPISVSQKQLLEAAESAQVHTFGWPFALVARWGDGKPRPRKDAVVAEIFGDRSYDYWTLTTDGRGYVAQSYFEDQRRPNHLFFDTRIIRVTEAFMYVGRLLTALGVSGDEEVTVVIRHVRLGGRLMAVASTSRLILPIEYRCMEQWSEESVTVRIAQLSEDLTPHVHKVLVPLFALFDFFEVGEGVYREISQAYSAGKVI